MRRNIASAVEGCLYSLLKTVPGRLSRYSKDLREEADILSRFRRSLLSMELLSAIKHSEMCSRLASDIGLFGWRFVRLLVTDN